MAFASLCNKWTNSSTLSTNFTADLAAGFTNFAARVAASFSVASKTCNGFDRAVIIPRMLGIRRSFYSTSPFLPPITIGRAPAYVECPPSISPVAVAAEPSIARSTHALTNGRLNNAASIAGTCCPL